MHWVYIVECKDGTLYTGWTTDIEKRLEKHNQGKGAKYTRSRAPVVLKHLEEFTSRQEAMQREWFIKSLVREEKLKIIANQR